MDRVEREQLWLRNCTLSIDATSPRIRLAHGEGGKLMRDLLRNSILPSLYPSDIPILEDAIRLPRIQGELAVTTDSFVVSPLFFPGGNIGTLSVFGTANDLAVGGARPRAITLSLIIEEGFPVGLLELVLQNISAAAKQTGVSVVTGDTKVVPGGAVDGLFINTTGLGEFVDPHLPGSGCIKEGDDLVVSGPIGCHGVAVLCAREDLALDPAPQSDCAPLLDQTRKLQQTLGPNLRAMRDATRGGVTAVLHEWASTCGLTLAIDESRIPVTPEIRGACELLGLDPLHVANEGTMLVAVANGFGDQAVATLREINSECNAAVIGKVKPRISAPVTVRRVLGNEQPLDEPVGSPLPRIC